MVLVSTCIAEAVKQFNIFQASRAPLIMAKMRRGKRTFLEVRMLYHSGL